MEEHTDTKIIFCKEQNCKELYKNFQDENDKHNALSPSKITKEIQVREQTVASHQMKRFSEDPVPVIHAMTLTLLFPLLSPGHQLRTLEKPRTLKW
jgi:hypothetical protein